MQECKPIRTPMDSAQKLSKEQCPRTAAERAEMDAKPYQQVVGSLMYAMVATRPDLAYSVGQLCQFMQNPGIEHWQAAVRLLRYLQAQKT